MTQEETALVFAARKVVGHYLLDQPVKDIDKAVYELQLAVQDFERSKESDDVPRTQEEYAHVLNLSGEVEKGNITMGDFERFVMERHGAEAYTDNHIHVVRRINRSGKETPEEERRYWHWCPRCEEFTNLWTTEPWGREKEIEALAAQLKRAARAPAI